jgi:hypothetical protein
VASASIAGLQVVEAREQIGGPAAERSAGEHNAGLNQLADGLPRAPQPLDIARAHHQRHGHDEAAAHRALRIGIRLRVGHLEAAQRDLRRIDAGMLQERDHAPAVGLDLLARLIEHIVGRDEAQRPDADVGGHVALRHALHRYVAVRDAEADDPATDQRARDHDRHRENRGAQQRIPVHVLPR